MGAFFAGLLGSAFSSIFKSIVNNGNSQSPFRKGLGSSKTAISSSLTNLIGKK